MRKELLILAVSGWFGMSGFSATNYVDRTRPDDSGSGTSWATAKRTIQAAVNAVSAGDTVLVAPGIYNEGMTVTPGGYLSNRVVVTKNITLASRDGASATVIQGARDPVDTTFQGCGSNAVRCVYMTAGTLRGFTLTGGATSSVNAQGVNERGGGLYGSTSISPLVYDCIISNNASIRGGGAYMGMYHRCLFTGNFASMNGAATRGVRAYDCLIVTNFGPGTVAYSTDAEGIVNCTIARNSGTALDNSKAYNSIITENPAVANSLEPVVNCCVPYAPAASSNNIIAADARFVDAANGDFRLLVNSPCLNTANTNFFGNAGAAAGRTDYFGNARLQGEGLDIGAVEGAALGVAAVTSEKQGAGAGSIAPLGRFVLASLPTQLVFTAAAGAGSALRHFTVNGAKAYGTGTTFTLTVTLPGTYTVAAVFYPARYVNAAEGSDAADGTTPATAWRTLQFAATNAAAGTLVLAAPGFYNEGVAYGASHSNRVSIMRNIVLKASAGPEQTFIVGAKDLVTGDANGRGPAAIRCAHMTAGALEGFTLTGGATSSGDTDLDPVRGGALYGIGGEVWDCIISNNVASRGSAAWGGTLRRCRIEKNLATSNGATRTAVLYDCLIVNNQGTWAVSYGCQLYNCTVSSNAAGGVSADRVYNSIIYGNAGTQVDVIGGITNSCMGSPLRPGTGNISADPLFIDPAAGDFRLQVSSPCVNMGNVAYGTGADGTDLAGAKRVFGAQIDMGAYEENTGGVRIFAGVSGGGGTITPAGALFWETLPMSQTFTAVPNPGRDFLYFSTNGVAIPNTGTSLTLSSATDVTLNLLAHFSAGTFYADAGRPDDSGDGASWASAKRTLQAAVDLTFDGDTVLVAPGTYNEGTRVTPSVTGYLLNRVVVTNNITLRSRDGAAATVVRGAFDAGSGDPFGRGPNAVRCVYLDKGTLQGFTLTGGATDSVNLENANNRGGGVYVPDYVYLPLVLDCVISNNASVRGGGTHAGTLKRCVVRDNYASNNGSGVRGSYAHHCLIANNRTGGLSTGSASAYNWLYNCTVADNEGRAGDNVEFYNCILTEPTFSSRHYDSCVSSGNAGSVTSVNSFVASPLFADAANNDYRLSAGSPCLDRANLAYVDNRFGTDLDGAMRMQNAKVDLGAYEWDWRPTFAAALDGSGLAVTNVTPFVTYATNAAYAAGAAVYLDGAAARTNQQATVEMAAPWQLPPYSRTVYLSSEVTGNGTLAIYEGAGLIDTSTAADGYQTLKYTALQNPCNLRFVYTPGTGDTGGALLDGFEGTAGLIMLLR